MSAQDEPYNTRLRSRTSIQSTAETSSTSSEMDHSHNTHDLDKSKLSRALRRGRALGDVSNTLDGVKATREKKAATRLRQRIPNCRVVSATDVELNDESAKITIADEDDNLTKPRRLSARLLAKRLKDEQEINKISAAKASSETITVSKGRDQTKRRRGSEGKSISKAGNSLPEAKRKRSKGSSGPTGTAVTAKQIDQIAKARLVTRINGEEQYIVHPDFRLQRRSFDGKNYTLGVARHDRDDNDILKVAPYVTDMFQHLYATELKTSPKLYMATQTDINSKMRAILIDWLIEVHMKFRLVPETLYICVNIIDRYCSKVQVQRSKLQLVGVTALLIACKYEEIYPPEVRDCVYITDRAYQSSEVLDMEQDIVHKLAFRITVPTAYPFLQRFLSITKAPPLVKHAASYYVERILQEHDMLRFKPSLICASAVILDHPSTHV